MHNTNFKNTTQQLKKCTLKTLEIHHRNSKNASSLALFQFYNLQHRNV